MSSEAWRWAGRITGFNPSHALVLKTLANYHNSRKGCAWPSISRIASESNGIGESTVRRCLRDLAALGLIVIVKITIDGHRRNAYRMCFNQSLQRPKTIPWRQWLREEIAEQAQKLRQPGESKAAFAQRLLNSRTQR